ncbi:hypothetical protein CFII68_01465 [Pseudomonas sp. CFII68]|nr:hypothetical protein CFII68_01465 [Pseudomonas sp. CFII68]
MTMLFCMVSMSALHQPRIVEYQKLGGLFFKLSRLMSGLKTLGNLAGVVNNCPASIKKHMLIKFTLNALLDLTGSYIHSIVDNL